MKKFRIFSVAVLLIGIISCNTSRDLRCSLFSGDKTKQIINTNEITEKVIKGFRWYDMGGASDNLKNLKDGAVSLANFKFTPIDTKWPKKRVFKNIVCVHVVVVMDANDDTGTDLLEVRDENGVLLYSSPIKEWFEVKEFDLNFKSSHNVMFRVSNNNTPNNTPGAFGLSIFMNGYFAKYHKIRSLVAQN